MAILRQDFGKTITTRSDNICRHLISYQWILYNHAYNHICRQIYEISFELKTMRNSVFSLVSIAGKYKLLHPLLQT